MYIESFAAAPFGIHHEAQLKYKCDEVNQNTPTKKK